MAAVVASLALPIGLLVPTCQAEYPTYYFAEMSGDGLVPPVEKRLPILL